jgi:type II secretory pathway component PulF
MKSASGREMVTLFRSLSIMMGAGVPLFACFEFLGREGESERLCQACRRVSQRLVQGYPLHKAAAPEPTFFDMKAIRLMEVGYQSGSLNTILDRLAADQEDAWKLTNQLKSGLVYPLGIAAIATLAVILLPPFVLSPLLHQVVELTAEPPAITRLLLAFSDALTSPWTAAAALALATTVTLISRTQWWTGWKDNLELYVWDLPVLGDLWSSIVAVRFLSVFALTYDCGLPATQCLTLSASATGSKRAHTRGSVMKTALVEGGTLKECMELGGFLPRLALETVEAGQQTGKVSDMLKRTSDIIQAELQSRVEAVTKLVEPLVLTILGVFVGVFALGCLLPIIKLTETL